MNLIKTISGLAVMGLLCMPILSFGQTKQGEKVNWIECIGTDVTEFGGYCLSTGKNNARAYITNNCTEKVTVWIEFTGSCYDKNIHCDKTKRIYINGNSKIRENFCNVEENSGSIRVTKVEPTDKQSNNSSTNQSNDSTQKEKEEKEKAENSTSTYRKSSCQYLAEAEENLRNAEYKGQADLARKEIARLKPRCDREKEKATYTSDKLLRGTSSTNQNNNNKIQDYQRSLREQEKRNAQMEQELKKSVDIITDQISNVVESLIDDANDKYLSKQSSFLERQKNQEKLKYQYRKRFSRYWKSIKSVIASSNLSIEKARSNSNNVIYAVVYKKSGPSFRKKSTHPSVETTGSNDNLYKYKQQYAIYYSSPIKIDLSNCTNLSNRNAQSLIIESIRKEMPFQTGSFLLAFAPSNFELDYLTSKILEIDNSINFRDIDINEGLVNKTINSNTSAYSKFSEQENKKLSGLINSKIIADGARVFYHKKGVVIFNGNKYISILNPDYFKKYKRENINASFLELTQLITKANKKSVQIPIANIKNKKYLPSMDFLVRNQWQSRSKTPEMIPRYSYAKLPLIYFPQSGEINHFYTINTGEITQYRLSIDFQKYFDHIIFEDKKYEIKRPIIEIGTVNWDDAKGVDEFWKLNSFLSAKGIIEFYPAISFKSKKSKNSKGRLQFSTQYAYTSPWDGLSKVEEYKYFYGFKSKQIKNLDEDRILWNTNKIKFRKYDFLDSKINYIIEVRTKANNIVKFRNEFLKKYDRWDRYQIKDNYLRHFDYSKLGELVAIQKSAFPIYFFGQNVNLTDNTKRSVGESLGLNEKMTGFNLVYKYLEKLFDNNKPSVEAPLFESDIIPIDLLEN